ncbi:2147_t:CDS:2 [Rhizophagus irregularis]|nr:2147_t:CDS:2 [Rhizophagus irregularis]
MLSPEEWDLLKDLKPILRTFSEATELLKGSSYCTISIMTPILIGIKKKFTPNNINYELAFDEATDNNDDNELEQLSQQTTTRKFNLKVPINTRNLLAKIKSAFYILMDYYWKDLTKPDTLLPNLLDPRIKDLSVITPSDFNDTKDLLREKYNNMELEIGSIQHQQNFTFQLATIQSSKSLAGLSPTMISRVMCDESNQSLLNQNNVQNNNTQDVRQNDNGKNEQENKFNKPLKKDYEDDLVKDIEKMKIYMLGKLQNIERKLDNKSGNRSQLNQGRNSRIPINYDEVTCFRCHRKGQFATRCPLGNNIRRNERRKDNPVQERRRSNRINPVRGWKNFGKLNFDKDIVERGKEDYKYRNREETPMEEEEDEQPMYNRPIGPDNTNIPKRYKWSKKRGEYYDTMEGINRWKEAGEKRRLRKDNIVGIKSKDPVDYRNLLNIVEQQGKMIKRMLKKGNKTE